MTHIEFINHQKESQIDVDDCVVVVFTQVAIILSPVTQLIAR